MKKTQGRNARLRCCASCQWIYTGETECPKCGFASYSARYVFGNACYRFALTQKPWYDQKMSTYACKLFSEICQTNTNKKPLPIKRIFMWPSKGDIKK